MNILNYVVKVTVQNNTQIQIWNSGESFFIGHPHKWELKKEESKILIVDVSTQKNVDSIALKDLTPRATSKKSNVIDLFDSTYDLDYKIEISEINAFQPVFEEKEKRPGASDIQVYHSQRAWILSADIIREKSYCAYSAAGLKVFSLKKSNRSGSISYELITYVDGVVLEDETKEKTQLIKKADKFFHAEALSKIKILHGEDFWTFSLVHATTVVPVPIWSQFLPAVNTAEGVLFQKSLKSALGVFGAIVVLAFIMSFFQTKEEAPEVTTILLPQKKTVKKLMTAAPKGDPKREETSMGTQGSQKNPGRKGSVAKVKTPTAKKEQPRSAPVQKVVKSTPRQNIQKSAAKAVTPPKMSQASTQKNSQSKQRVAQVQKQKRPAGPSQSLQKAAQSLMQGGATALLAQSRFGSGSDIRSEGQAVARGQGGGSSLTRGGDIGTSGAQTLSAGSGQVSGFGGGGGSASGQGDGGPGSSGAGYGRGSHARVSGQGRSFVSLDEGASEVDEGLTKDQVGRVIHKHMSEIRYCYESSTVRNPNVGGRLSVQFKINPHGQVSSSGVARSTVGDSRLNNCIVSRLKQWQFPKPKGGVEVAVTYPFIFKTL